MPLYPIFFAFLTFSPLRPTKQIPSISSGVKVYTYGIKACADNGEIEDTMFIADSTFGDENLIIVYPRKVNGV